MSLPMKHAQKFFLLEQCSCRQVNLQLCSSCLLNGPKVADIQQRILCPSEEGLLSTRIVPQIRLVITYWEKKFWSDVSPTPQNNIPLFYGSTTFILFSSFRSSFSFTFPLVFSISCFTFSLEIIPPDIPISRGRWGVIFDTTPIQNTNADVFSVSLRIILS